MSQQVLMTIGAAFVVCLAAMTVYFGIGLAKAKKTAEIPAEPIVAPEEPAVRPRVRYDDAYAALKIPPNAMTLRLACNCIPAGVPLKHYCWVNDDGELVFFPVWESLEALLGPDAAGDSLPREWRIPVKNIICFAAEQDFVSAFVVLQYKQGEDVINLAFAEDAARVFSSLMPDKDFSNLLEELYPKSSKNIRDIKEKFVSLRDLRDSDLISEDEYAAKRKELVISL